MQEVKCRIEGSLFIAEGELVSDLAGRLVPEGTVLEGFATKVDVTEQGTIKFSVTAGIVLPKKEEALAAEPAAEIAASAEPASPAEAAQEGSQS